MIVAANINFKKWMLRNSVGDVLLEINDKSLWEDVGCGAESFFYLSWCGWMQAYDGCIVSKEECHNERAFEPNFVSNAFVVGRFGPLDGSIKVWPDKETLPKGYDGAFASWTLPTRRGSWASQWSFAQLHEICKLECMWQGFFCECPINRSILINVICNLMTHPSIRNIRLIWALRILINLSR